MSTTAPHLPARPARRLPTVVDRTADVARSFDRAALRRTLLRRFDDPPGVDVMASPSDLAVREVGAAHWLPR